MPYRSLISDPNVEPTELSSFLRRLASNLESSPNPSRKMVSHSVEYALRSVQAGKVTKVVDRDYSTIVHNLDALIKHLVKAVGTLKPEDEAKSHLERSIEQFRKIKSNMTREFKNLAKVEL